MKKLFFEKNMSPLNLTKGSLKGFTLMEVVMVIGFLTIIAAIALPLFQRLAINTNLKSAAREIVGDFSNLKSRAIGESRIYKAVFDVVLGSYTLYQCTTQDTPCPGWIAVGSRNLSYFGRDIAFTSSLTTVRNYVVQMRGTATPGTIVLANSRGSNATITVNITGRTWVEYDLR